MKAVFLACWALIVVAPLLLAGCAAPKTFNYTSPGNPHPARTVEQDGLRAVVDPIMDPERSKSYFATDALSKGIFPIHVHLHNTTSEASLLIDQSEMKLLAADAQSAGTSATHVEYRNRTAEVTGTVGVVLISPALIFASGPQVARALAVQHSFAEKEFPGRITLSAGRSADGFVYFSIPARKVPAGSFLQLKATDLRSQRIIVIETPLNP